MYAKYALVVCVALLAIAAAWNGNTTAAVGQDAAAGNANRQHDADALLKAKKAYGEALMKMAQANLDKMQEANARVPDTIPTGIVRAVANDIAIDTARLRAMLDIPTEGENPYVVAAQESLSIAEQSLRQAETANQRAPGAISEGEVARRQAEVNLARTRLEVAKQLVGADPLEIARWQILQLQEDVHNLRFRMQLMQYRN